MSEANVVVKESPSRRGSRAAVRQVWAERLARFPGSGLSAAQFCAQEGVAVASFYAWKRRLAASAAAPAAGVDARLLSVRVAAPPAAVEVVLPCGTVVRLQPGCDLPFVRAVVAALGGGA
jgi:hypothetical protein